MFYRNSDKATLTKETRESRTRVTRQISQKKKNVFTFTCPQASEQGYSRFMKFCSQCGEAAEQIVPEGDTRPRSVCTGCATIHYVNPKVIAGTLPIWQDKVLLCKRAIEPRKGYWTLPAGFLENGETVEVGAARETTEEANARLEDMHLYTIFSLPHISQVYMFFRAKLTDLDFSSGSESLEVALFDESDIPWDELAFPVINKTLEYYFADRQNDAYPTHYEDILFRRRS